MLNFKALPSSKEAARKRIFCALDTPDLERAVGLAKELSGHIGGLKVGKEFFTEFGSVGLRKIEEVGMPLFLDLKFHDIPNTVAGAVRAAVRLKPMMLNVHASGGRRMLKEAVKAAEEESENIGIEKPLVIAVTLLTSQDQKDLEDIGVDRDVESHVASLALMSKECGLDGVVCSGQEIERIKDVCGEKFLTVVPGLRPPGYPGDQKRIMSPHDAFDKGADFLVIGRPITGAERPAPVAADFIVDQIVGDKTSVDASELWNPAYST